MKDPHVNALITLLLNKNPESRLGGSFLNLKKHAAFEKISWVKFNLFRWILSAKR
jgi:hypothetical protein